MTRRLSPVAVAVALVTVLVATTWLVTWQRLEFERGEAIAAASRANSNLAMAFQENVSNAFDDIGAILVLMDVEYRHEGAGVARAMGNWPLDKSLVRGVAIFDRGGRTIMASGDVPTGGIASRAQFVRHRDEDTDRLQIGLPAREGSAGPWRVAVSRRMENGDGTFAGIAVATIDPAFFARFARQADLGSNGLVVLVGRNGSTFARHAGAVSTYGSDAVHSKLLGQQSRSPSGTFISAGTRDGVRRLMSYRTLQKYDLFVQVGTAEDDALAPVRERSRIYYLLAALATCLTILVASAVVRFLKRQDRHIRRALAAESQLRAAEARSRAITENMAGGVITTDVHGTILSVNSTACRIYGYEVAEMVGRPVSDLVHASSHPELERALRALDTADGLAHARVTQSLDVRKNGTLFEAEVRRSRVVMDGATTCIALVNDVSEGRRMERELRSSESRLRATFNQALVGIVHTDLQGRFILVNQMACDLLGYTREEMLARGYRHVTHPEDLVESEARHKALLAEPQRPFEYHVTRRFLCKDGSVLWALCSVCVIRREDGEPDYFLSMVQDITELKRVERMKNEFVSTVSHELRTPLTSIRGSLGLLAGGVVGALPVAARELVLIAETNCERLIRLVNDILDTEKIDSGKMNFNLGVLPLRPLMERALESLQGLARANSIAMRLAAPEEPVLACVDPDRFIQVLTNLVSNAVHFSPPQAAVDVSLARDGGGARIEVRDRGPGIPREFQGRIFQRFSQADGSDSRQKSGSGLGLCIAKGIVERLGGTIGFTSTPGEGSTFFVQLPEPAQAASPRDARTTAEEARTP